ncbi:MAG: twin-arginine translocase TatA/TatE family subunit [Chloroflexi bacterium]|nr:twin-arginine translocase TatA/TatE family subunit [Chloroflexota bacterium]
MNVFGIGGMELIVIGLVAFLLLGPRKMAEAGKTVAKILGEVRRQRDELTAAIMQEPDPRGANGPAGTRPAEEAKSPGPAKGVTSGPTPGQDHAQESGQPDARDRR